MVLVWDSYHRWPGLRGNSVAVVSMVSRGDSFRNLSPSPIPCSPPPSLGQLENRCEVSKIMVTDLLYFYPLTEYYNNVSLSELDTILYWDWWYLVWKLLLRHLLILLFRAFINFTIYSLNEYRNKVGYDHLSNFSSQQSFKNYVVLNSLLH